MYFFEEVETNTDPLTLANMVEAGFEGISKKIEVKSVGSRFTESKLLSCQMYVLLSRIDSWH